MAQATNYKKIQKIKKNYKYKSRTLKSRESMLAMWMSTRIKIPSAQKFNQLVYSLSKSPLQKILTQEAFAKNGESGLAMWKNHLF